MVMMTKNRDYREPVGSRDEVDCRGCLHYPKPNTTGKVEDFVAKTNNWTESFCGADECEGKEYTPNNVEASVNKGDTDGPEQAKEDTDDIEPTK